MNIPQNLFHLKSLRAFLMKSNLKDLGLTYSSQEINFLFKNELTLPLERLSLSLLDYEKPQFPFNILERHTDLKSLDLNLDLYWDNINPILKTLTCLPKLEDLNLKLKQIPDCKEFKRILSNLFYLKSFGLEFIQELVINNVELKSLIKCFQALRGIIKFRFISNCTNRIDNSTYEELISFVKTNKQLRSQHFRITELNYPKILPICFNS